MKVFTNGCFDLLHRGHLNLLQYCYDIGKQADRLILEGRVSEPLSKVVVGLNSDNSVRRLKGSGRPIIKQEERKYLLSCLLFVDEVHIFDEDTPRRLIEEMEPDTIVKGGRPYEGDDAADFANRQPTAGDIFQGKLLQTEAEKEETEGYMIRPFRMVEGYSTTKILDEILSNR